MLQIGLTVTWPDGTLGTAVQADIRRDEGQDAILIPLRVVRNGVPDIFGRLRLTYEALNRIQGPNDVAKSQASATAFAAFVAQQGLLDGFAFSLDAPVDVIVVAPLAN